MREIIIKLLFPMFIAIHQTESPKIATFTFGDEALKFGESASVQCTVSGGDLPMAIKWILNGEEIPPYLEVSTSKIGKRTLFLSIDSVRGDHAGNYSCIASNQAGSAEFTAPLVVIGLFVYQNGSK